MARAFEIFGLSALIARFMGASIDKSSREGMERAAAHLTGEIKSRAPVDTGHLRDSYDYFVDGSGNSVTAHVGTNVEYAIHQEYGTQYQSGTPHVRPAIEANRSQLVEMMGKEVLTKFISDVGG